MKIGLVYDLRSDYLAEGFSEEAVAEFDSDETIWALESTLRHLGFDPERIGHGRALAARLVAGDRWDMVFTIAEGVSGRSREAQVPCLLEMYGIPYTFSDPLVCALTLDKNMTKRVVRESGFPTPASCLVEAVADIGEVRLRYPLFAKPVAEGTGKGIDGRSRIDGPEQLESVCRALLTRFHQPVLVEEYLPGREFTTAILGSGEDASVLGTMEVIIREDAPTRDYSYEIKELCEQYVAYRPIEPGDLKLRIAQLALGVYRTLQCRDTGRVDIRLDAAGNPSFVEINPLPGLHPSHSDLPMIATQEGMSYDTLIGRIVESATRRAGIASEMFRQEAVTIPA